MLSKTKHSCPKQTLHALSFCIGLLLGTHSQSTLAASSQMSRQKVIDFDESLVEGMGKRPLDSFQQESASLSNEEGRRLYRIRKSFRHELSTTLQEKRGVR